GPARAHPARADPAGGDARDHRGDGGGRLGLPRRGGDGDLREPGLRAALPRRPHRRSAAAGTADALRDGGPRAPRARARHDALALSGPRGGPAAAIAAGPVAGSLPSRAPAGPVAGSPRASRRLSLHLAAGPVAGSPRSRLRFVTRSPQAATPRVAVRWRRGPTPLCRAGVRAGATRDPGTHALRKRPTPVTHRALLYGPGCGARPPHLQRELPGPPRPEELASHARFRSRHLRAGGGAHARRVPP